VTAQSEARRAASTKPACQSHGVAVAGVESPSHAWGGQRWDWGGRWQRSQLGRTAATQPSSRLGRGAAARATGDWGDWRARAAGGNGEGETKTSGATGRQPAIRRLQKRAAHEERAAAHAEVASSGGPREGASSA
jgi:hypothetical protein